jgi:hypothetical protein
LKVFVNICEVIAGSRGSSFQTPSKSAELAGTAFDSAPAVRGIKKTKIAINNLIVDFISHPRFVGNA